MKPNKFNLAGYIIYLLLVVLAADYVLYLIYTVRFDSSVWPDKKFDRITEKTGFWPPYPLDRKSYYTNFKPEKSLSSVRIGCFGDSFTYGNAVDDGYDYPALLRNILYKEYALDVEVINFGHGWHGFHQTFMVWDEFHDKYALDYVVLGPGGFWADRELTFNHTLSNQNSVAYPYYCHSRYILSGKGDDARRVDYSALSARDAGIKYLSFIPGWDRLRYDSSAPLFLSAPVKLFFPGNDIVNPFYYRAGMKDEGKRINTILLNKIVAGSRDIFLPMWEESRISASLPVMPVKDNFGWSLLGALPDFLYSMPSTHKSPLGNYFLAQVVAAYLTGSVSAEVDILLPQDIEGGVAAQPNIFRRPLCDYRSMHINIGGTNVARFYNVFDNIAQPSFSDASSVRYKALLGIKGAGQSNVDALFLPLSFELQGAEAVSLRIYDTKGKVSCFRDDKVTMVDKDLNIGFTGFDLVRGYASNAIILKESCLGHRFKAGEKVVISVNGKDIFSGIVRDYFMGGLCLRIRDGYWVLIRALGSVLPDMAAISEQGYIYIDMEDNNRSGKVPFAMYRKKKVVIKFNKPVKDPIVKKLQDGKAK